MTDTNQKPALRDRSEQVYLVLRAARSAVRVPATLDIAGGVLSLTATGDNSRLLSCPTNEIRKVAIDHATLHFFLAQQRVALALYATGQSRATTALARLLYVGTVVNGWANLRDERLRTWKRDLRAGGVKVADRNLLLLPLAALMTVFAVFILAALGIQIADWL
jgi:hypothetical protein